MSGVVAFAATTTTPHPPSPKRHPAPDPSTSSAALAASLVCLEGDIRLRRDAAAAVAAADVARAAAVAARAETAAARALAEAGEAAVVAAAAKCAEAVSRGKGEGRTKCEVTPTPHLIFPSSLFPNRQHYTCLHTCPHLPPLPTPTTDAQSYHRHL